MRLIFLLVLLMASATLEEQTPSWITEDTKKLLETPKQHLEFDLIVAQDMTGNFTTISEAITSIPSSSSSSRTFKVFIKKGVYAETVILGVEKTNVMLIGEEGTVIRGYKSARGGVKTFFTPTVVVEGDRAILRDLVIINDAGPSNEQAVACRADSDQAAFFCVKFMGYQDTLYSHSKRQFFRECEIYGTIDFICGAGTAVFQYCTILARRPLKGQSNVITSQARKGVNDSGGFSFIKCRILPAPDLIPVTSMFSTYLGRPWGKYSTTAFLNCYLDDFIHPSGWTITKKGYTDTCLYREFNNTGAGAKTEQRVNWLGFKVIKDAREAAEYSVSKFIQGDEWLPRTNISYFSGLN